jgi:hypothetical protein
MLGSLEEEDARKVAEAFFDDQTYKQASDDVKATVDRFRAWLDANQRLGRSRAARSGRTGKSR